MELIKYIEILEEAALFLYGESLSIDSGFCIDKEILGVPLYELREEIFRRREQRAETEKEKSRTVVIRYRREPNCRWTQACRITGQTHLICMDEGLWHSELWVGNGLAAREYVKILEKRLPGEYVLADVRKGPGLPDLGWRRASEWSWEFTDPGLQQELTERRFEIDRSQQLRPHPLLP